MGRRKKRNNIFSKLITTKFFFIFLGFFLLLGIISLAGYVFFTASFFKIKGQNLKSDLDLGKKLIKEIEDKSIFKINLDKLYSAIKKEYPGYKQITILKNFPNTIEIRAKKRKPLAQVRAKKFYLIDSEGIIIKRGQEGPFPNLPTITGLRNNAYLAKGSKINQFDLEVVFNLMKLIKEKNVLKEINSLNQDYRYKLAEINISSPEIIYFYLSNEKYYQDRIKIILNQKEMKAKIGLLIKLMTQKLKNKLSLIRYIDFRFQKVAVGFKR